MDTPGYKERGTYFLLGRIDWKRIRRATMRMEEPTIAFGKVGRKVLWNQFLDIGVGHFCSRELAFTVRLLSGAIAVGVFVQRDWNWNWRHCASGANQKISSGFIDESRKADFHGRPDWEALTIYLIHESKVAIGANPRRRSISKKPPRKIHQNISITERTDSTADSMAHDQAQTRKGVPAVIICTLFHKLDSPCPGLAGGSEDVSKAGNLP